ncbi:MAG: hypothetical protein KC589_09155, partial [Nanoarchaeota archaeon]|nr:hypothetical protein [Nanoarchaeota archaeon]
MFLFLINLAFSYINISTCTKINSTFLGNETEVRLTANISNHDGTCMDVTTGNFKFDCQGYEIDGDGDMSGYGIFLTGSDYVNITNCNVRDFRMNLVIYSSSDYNKITNTVLKYGENNIIVQSASNNYFNNVSSIKPILGSKLGLLYYGNSDNNVLNNSYINNSVFSVFFNDGSDNNIINNSIIENSISTAFSSGANTGNKIYNTNVTVGVSGISHTSTTSFQVYDNVRFNNLSSYAFHSNSNVGNIILKNSYINNSNKGIYFVGIGSNTVENVSITGSVYGIEITGSTSHNFQNISVFNSDYGILLSGGFHNFQNITVNNSLYYGIQIGSSNNVFESFAVNNSGINGIYISGGDSNNFTKGKVENSVNVDINPESCLNNFNNVTITGGSLFNMFIGSIFLSNQNVTDLTVCKGNGSILNNLTIFGSFNIVDTNDSLVSNIRYINNTLIKIINSDNNTFNNIIS